MLCPAHREAWKQLGDKTRTESMLEYVSLLSNLEPGWQDHHEHEVSAGTSMARSARVLSAVEHRLLRL